ncbi:MAG: hypothetical protein AAGE59_32275 [Cyanobacteria bacterium P01_F01_bin.86]
MALWTLATPAAVQGRVFASHILTYDLVSVPITFMADPLSDRVFEPAMQSAAVMQGVFVPIVGAGPGSGMMLLFSGSAIICLMVGILSWRLPAL